MLIVKETELKRYSEIIESIEHTVIVFSNGETWWTIDGKRHREDNNPAVTTALGDQFWYKNNKLHREQDLPAVISNTHSIQEWWFNGLEHRENGKASFINLENKEVIFYINGNEVTEAEAIKHSLKNKLDKF